VIDPKSKPMNLEGKVAVITGASSGIGRALARRFASLGANVVAADINEDGGQETVGMIEKDGGKAVFTRCDVTSYEDAKAAVATARESFGRIDILVNNAGWDKVEFFLQNDPSHWNRVIDINLKGQIHMARAAFEAMTEQGEGGRIVNMASDAGRVGQMGEAVYSACKGGIIAFTKALAREAARGKILVNSVAPGITDTPLIAGLEPKTIEATVKAIPLKRMADPDEPAEVAAFLASDSNTYMTGQVISCSGGLTMVD
jgi:2-hydroxycyclohexanecarboxyl-CoA dehydrogenase